MLDLRGNGGGLIDVAFKIANAMTPDKGVTLAGVRYRDDMGGLDETVSTGGGLPLNKIVVLVNGGTASAAELLTGILQDTAENVTVVGEKDLRQGAGVRCTCRSSTATSWSLRRSKWSCPARAAGRAGA